MLIIFDVDGTLIGGEETDWKCFDDAFHQVAGFQFPPKFFDDLHEVTAKAIVHQALPNENEAVRIDNEERVRDECLARLTDAHRSEENVFFPTRGAPKLLSYLSDRNDFSVAIATGDWEDTINFKCRVAGIEIDKYPLATSSDCYARSEIITLAASRANWSLDNSIYIGDGLWDYQAAITLGIPFVAVGHRIERLLDAGAIHSLPSLDPEHFVEWFKAFKAAENCSGGDVVPNKTQN